MKNPLESYLKENGLNIAEASRASGMPYMTIIQHLHKKRRISPELAIKYKNSFGIPLSSLRPDLWPPEERDKCILPPQSTNKE